MGRRARWAAGAAAVVLPVLATASPASAARIVDEDATGEVTFALAGGGTATCTGIGAQQVLDTDTGDAGASLSIGGPPACRGRIDIAIRYTDDHGDPSHADASSRHSAFGSLFVYDVGGRVTTVDYRVEFDDCASNCVHTLQTSTK